jgi:tetratricopeptide (TPR) repeat protein
MKKLSWTAATPCYVAMLFSATLALICTFSRPALAAGPQQASATSDIAMSVKNPAARQLVTDAEKAFRSGNTTVALTLLRRATDAAPKDGWIRLALGRALVRTNNPVSGEEQLRQARTDGVPDDIALPSIFGAMIIRHEELKLLNEFPAPAANATGKVNADILEARAMALLALGHADEAAASMDRSLALSRDTESLLVRARIAVQQNNPALARGLRDEALKRDPKNGRAMLAKLGDLQDAGDYRGALALSEQLLKQFPNDTTTRATRIEIFLHLGQDEKASGELKVLMAKAPNAPVTQYYNALFLSRANNPVGAWKIAQTLPPEFTQSTAAYAVSLSQMAVNSGNAETGAAILASALTKSPDNLDLRLRLATIRLRQDSPESAARVMEPINDSNDPLALDMMGYIALQTGDTKEALEKLTRAHDAQPKNGEITFHLIQALDANGTRNTAKGLLKSLLAGGSSFDDLQNARRLEKSWH